MEYLLKIALILIIIVLVIRMGFMRMSFFEAINIFKSNNVKTYEMLKQIVSNPVELKEEVATCKEDLQDALLINVISKEIYSYQDGNFYSEDGGKFDHTDNSYFIAVRGNEIFLTPGVINYLFESFNYDRRYTLISKYWAFRSLNESLENNSLKKTIPSDWWCFWNSTLCCKMKSFKNAKLSLARIHDLSKSIKIDVN
jgi:hypothetical protein